MSHPSNQQNRFRYILFYKPYGVLSQFTAVPGHRSLKEFGPFPPAVYPVGRLDEDSEGLLLLTDDPKTNHRLTDPTFGHPKTYCVQVENIPDEEDLEKLREGVVLSGKRTLPSEVSIILDEPNFPARAIPIRYRKNIPTTWLQLTLHEGKNRQVRRMTAAVGHPTLRLIRTRLMFLDLNGLTPGTKRELTPDEILQLRDLLRI